MAHFAEINENNIVIRVLVTDNDMPNEGYDFLIEAFGGTWIKTSYNTYGGVHYDPHTRQPSSDQSKALRKNFAGIGFAYDLTLDAFIPPKFFESWVLNTEKCLWESPVEYPKDGKRYSWNESIVNWELVETEEE